MRKLILAIVLGVTLGVPAVSSAQVNALGVHLPVDRNEPKSNVEHGFVPDTAAESYQPQELNEQTNVYEKEKTRYSAFGVSIESAVEG